MEVKFKPEADFFFPSYDGDFVYSIYMKMPFDELLNEYWGVYSTSYYLVENFGLTPDSFIGEYADYLLMIMRQVISERACLMFL